MVVVRGQPVIATTATTGVLWVLVEVEVLAGDWYDLVDSDQFSLDVYDALLSDLDEVKLLNYVPTYRDIEVYIENGISTVESPKLDERFSIGDTVMDKCIQANFMQDGIHTTSVGGGEEADKYRFIDLDQDLFQQANVVDEEDNIDMVDELQQGNEDVVFGNIDFRNKDVAFRNIAQEVDKEVIDWEEHVVDASQEAKTVDEINASDESEFEEDKIPLTEPQADMNDFHFEVDAHINHVTSLAEFPTRKDIKDEIIMYAMKSRRSNKQLIDRYDGPLTPTAHGIFRLIKQEAKEYNVIWNEGHIPVQGTLERPINNQHDSSWQRGWDTRGLVAQCRPRMKRITHKDVIVKHAVKKMVKDGKMSRKGTIMSCGKCGGKGHNKRGCTNPRDIQVNGKTLGWLLEKIHMT
ncbi:hypothetical protein Tco_1243135 [Tanacetum coccineum]